MPACLPAIYQRSFIQPSKPMTIKEGTESSEYGSEYGSEYESEYESDEGEGGAAGVAGVGGSGVSKVQDDTGGSEYESDSEIEDEDDEDEVGAVGFALYDWEAPEAGQCSLTLGNKYRVTHDGEVLLSAGWIGVVPAGGGTSNQEDRGLVPRSYIQLPDAYLEGSVSAAAAAAAAAEGSAPAVEDDTTSEYETETETEDEEDEASDQIEAEEVADEEVEAEAEAAGEEEEDHAGPSGTSSQEYESEYETTEEEEEEEEEGEEQQDDALNTTTGSLHAVQSGDELETVRELMLHIYEQHNPRKIDDVDRLLKEWEGEERLLLAKIRAKYEND
eukprot:COSAG06_NODE_5592_length_3377_cov_10.967663_3_plen_331_part_00